MSIDSEEPGPESANGRTVVLYDGGCPMCRREIGHYRRLRGATRIDWVDIGCRTGVAERHGIGTEQAMERLHVRDRCGRWHSGAAAFIALWSELSAYRWLGRTLVRLHLTGMLEAAYRPFARWRLRRRCRDGHCDATGDRA